ncbi:MAG: BadF/BadG/BcrA/BcrD ATPase family protein [Stellaceae bacterium]
MMTSGDLFLGVDGGGTRCRARLALGSGAVLGEGEAGPANLHLGFLEAFAAVLDGTRQCLRGASLPLAALERTTACLALAGASEPAERARASRHPLPFHRTIIATDAEAACIGAHPDGDGGVIVIGTGSIGWAIVDGLAYRIGGWGLQLSDEGSGAWLGREVLRRVLWAHDARLAWSPLLTEIFARFGHDPHAIIRWTATAKPADYGSLAPLVVALAEHGDEVGGELMRIAAGYIDALAARLVAIGATRIALTGGLAAAIEPHLAAVTRRHLVAPRGDALTGALQIAAGAASYRALPA